jgi:hypothetical protein
VGVAQIHDSAFHAWPQVVRLAGTVGPNRTFSYIGRFGELCSDLNAILVVLGVERQRVQATHAIMRELQARACHAHGRAAEDCACPALEDKGVPSNLPPTPPTRLHERLGCDDLHVRGVRVGGAALVPDERTNASLGSVLSSDLVCFGLGSGIPL